MYLYVLHVSAIVWSKKLHVSAIVWLKKSTCFSEGKPLDSQPFCGKPTAARSEATGAATACSTTPAATYIWVLTNRKPAHRRGKVQLIRERQREGIALAKQRGAYRGRKKALSPEQAAELSHRVKAGARKAPLARELGISRETLYQYLRTDD